MDYITATLAPLLWCAEEPASPFLTRLEAASYLRVSVRTFDARVRAGVPEHRIGRKPLFKKEDLAAWLDDRRLETAETRRTLLRPLHRRGRARGARHGRKRF